MGHLGFGGPSPSLFLGLWVVGVYTPRWPSKSRTPPLHCLRELGACRV